MGESVDKKHEEEDDKNNLSMEAQIKGSNNLLVDE